MSYDSGKTRNLLKMAGGFSAHPTGEYISELARQLTDAEGEIMIARNDVTKAQSDANRYAAELATMQSTIRQLREENEELKNPKPVAPAPKKARSVKVSPAPEAPTPATQTNGPESHSESPKRTRKKKSEIPNP